MEKKVTEGKVSWYMLHDNVAEVAVVVVQILPGHHKGNVNALVAKKIDILSVYACSHCCWSFHHVYGGARITVPLCDVSINANRPRMQRWP